MKSAPSNLPKTMCYMPWHGTLVGPEGHIRICCVSHDILGNTTKGHTAENTWNSERLQKIRKQFLNGEFPKGCINCEQREKLVGESQRTQFNRFITDIHGEPENLAVEAELNLTRIDFSFSFLCNLKCRFCGPWASSKWVEDGEQLSAESPSFTHYKYHGHEGKIANHTANDLLELVKRSPNLRAIDFKGGEPLIHPELRKALQGIIDLGSAKNICLSITTNGTYAPTWLPELFKQFQNVTLIVSAEATGAMYKYIRGGSYDLEQVETSLRIFDRIENLNGGINVAFSPYSLFEATRFYDWFVDLNLKTFKDIWFPPVITPHHLNVTVLPLEFRQKAAANIDPHHPVLAPIYKILSEPSGWDAEPQAQQKHFNNFLLYTKLLDKMRKTSLVDVSPEFAEIFQCDKASWSPVI